MTGSVKNNHFAYDDVPGIGFLEGRYILMVCFPVV